MQSTLQLSGTFDTDWNTLNARRTSNAQELDEFAKLEQELESNLLQPHPSAIRSARTHGLDPFSESQNTKNTHNKSKNSSPFPSPISNNDRDRDRASAGASGGGIALSESEDNARSKDRDRERDRPGNRNEANLEFATTVRAGAGGISSTSASRDSYDQVRLLCMHSISTNPPASSCSVLLTKITLFLPCSNTTNLYRPLHIYI